MQNTKKIIIVGDSYSTFDGFIPEGYETYYSTQERYPDMGVTSHTETWWHIFKESVGAEILENNSWSGSTVSYTGRQGDCSASSSFIYRLRCLAEGDFEKTGKPDTLIIFGATNDSWIDVPLGERKLDGFAKSDLYSVLPAVACIIGEARAVLPDARIIYIINTELKPEIGAQVKAASEHYGTEYLELSDIDKISGHPTSLGMRQIAEQLEAHLSK